MLGKLRNFSKTKLATILVGIIIIPFVLWGMGSVFSGGNTNSIAKIDNKNISTKDFVDHINSSGLDLNYIKNNINNNLLEQLLSQLISQKMIDLEIEKLNISISDQVLKKKITNNKIFKDEEDTFSRVKYEKYLLENNLNAPIYEKKFKDNELKKKLFLYIDGGIKLPYFLANKKFEDENKSIDIEFINLKNEYKNEFTSNDYKTFINENLDLVSLDFIDFEYSRIAPLDLIQVDEFNKEFYDKIDQIDNDLANGLDIAQISNKYNLKLTNQKNYNEISTDDKNILFEEIFANRNIQNAQIIEKDNYFILFEIKKINKKVPDLENKNFLNQIKNNLLLNEKYEYNKSLLQKIEKNQFNENDFYLLGSSNLVKKGTIESINDTKYFDLNSIKLIYSIGKNSFVLTSDNENNVYIVKINNINIPILKQNSDEEKEYLDKTSKDIKASIYVSYDYLVNNSYKIKVNQNTMERVRNYFK